MNERINELFEQALEEFNAENKYATIIVPNPLKEKFAELIVEECAKRAEVYAYMSPNFNALAEELRKMIGVEA